MNFILDIWTGFIELLEYLDKKVNGADSNRFQDWFIKVKLVECFLAFTIPTEGDGKIVRRIVESCLDFEFKEKEKSFMEFRNQIGSVLRLNLRISDRLCRFSGQLIFSPKVTYSITLNSFFVQCSLDKLSMP